MKRNPKIKFQRSMCFGKRARCNSKGETGPLSLPPRGKIKIKIRSGSEGGAKQNKTKNEESKEDRKGVCTEFH